MARYHHIWLGSNDDTGKRERRILAAHEADELKHGITHNFGGILSVRLIMGAFEAGFFVSTPPDAYRTWLTCCSLVQSHT